MIVKTTPAKEKIIAQRLGLKSPIEYLRMQHTFSKDERSRGVFMLMQSDVNKALSDLTLQEMYDILMLFGPDKAEILDWIVDGFDTEFSTLEELVASASIGDPLYHYVEAHLHKEILNEAMYSLTAYYKERIHADMFKFAVHGGMFGEDAQNSV